MNKKLIIVGAVVVTAIVIMVIVYFLCQPKDYWKGTYAVGDFVEYDVITRDGESTVRYTVTEVSATEVTLNIATNGNSYRIENLSTDSSFAFGLWPDFKLFPGSVTHFTETNEIIDTSWGPLNCRHIVDTEGPSYKLYDEEWVYHGVVIKSTSSSPGGFKNMVLVDTNMEEVISG